MYLSIDICAHKTKEIKALIHSDTNRAISLCQSFVDDLNETLQYMSSVITLPQIRDKMEIVKSLIGNQNDQAIQECDDINIKIEDAELIIQTLMNSLIPT